MSAGLSAATIAVLEFPPVGRDPAVPAEGQPRPPVPSPTLLVPPTAGHWEGADGRGPASLSSQAPGLLVFYIKKMFFSHLGSRYNKQPPRPYDKEARCGGFMAFTSG